MTLLLDPSEFEKYLPKKRRVLKYMADIEAMKADGHSLETIAMAISKATELDVSVKYLNGICYEYRKKQKGASSKSPATA